MFGNYQESFKYYYTRFHMHFHIKEQFNQLVDVLLLDQLFNLFADSNYLESCACQHEVIVIKQLPVSQFDNYSVKNTIEVFVYG